MFINLEYLNLSTNHSLFHYTKKEGMEGILKNEIWLTHFKHLNDPEELKNIIILYKKIVQKNCEDKGFMKYVSGLIHDGDYELKNNSEGIYILSLTMDNNSEYMWKNYANNGVNLEFCTPTELEYFFHFDHHRLFNIKGELQKPNAHIIFGKVYYSDDEIEKFLYNIYNDKKETTDHKDVVIDFESMEMFLKTSYIRFFKKNEKWEYENEYRLVIILNDNENEKFRHYRNEGISYIRLDFKADDLLKGININSDLEYSARYDEVDDIMKKTRTIPIPIMDLGLQH